MRTERPSVAVVGTGVAGLTAAHLLDPGHELTVFEAEPRIGGHTNTIRVVDPRGEIWVDTGFIVHNHPNYPRFTALLDELGVDSQPTEMGMSICSRDGRFEFANTRRGLFAQRSNLLRPAFWGLIRDQLRFNREVRPLAGRTDTPTVGEFLRDSGYSRWFCERAIAPEIAAVWSAGSASIWDFPLGFSGRVPLQPRPAPAHRPAPMADDPGRFAQLRRAARRAARRPDQGGRPGAANRAPRRLRRGRGRGL